MEQEPAVAGRRTYDVGGSGAAGTTRSVSVDDELDSVPVNCAGGAGSIDTGPTSMR